MEYEKLTDAVRKCEFISDPEKADSAVKAVLGILASSLEEDEARKLTESLPEPLTLDRLRGHQARPLRIYLTQLISEIGEEFKLTDSQAALLIMTVLRKTERALDNPELKACLKEFSDDLDGALNSGAPLRNSLFTCGSYKSDVWVEDRGPEII